MEIELGGVPTYALKQELARREAQTEFKCPKCGAVGPNWWGCEPIEVQGLYTPEKIGCNDPTYRVRTQRND